MRNLEYHASNIVMEMILFPERKQYITFKPLSDMVERMLREILEFQENENH